MASFFFYDYETTGIEPKSDRIIQFAGIRTDENFEIIDSPVSVYSKLSRDIIPNPEALLITGISAATLQQQGIPEIELMRLIYQEFSKPNTSVAGYNNIRFDDEFTRYGFYRNFYDPYTREWQNNNSRWDLIDVVRMCSALRPEGIIWPYQEGKISYKLEGLTKANSLEHIKAHDALSDVYATIAIAKLINKAQPKLLKFLLNCRKKTFVKNFINLDAQDLNTRLIVHSSRMISSEFYATSVFIPLLLDPINPNNIISWDLRYDPQVLLDLDGDLERASYLLYTPQSELHANEQRLALKNIAVNKVPAIAPINTLNPEVYSRIKLNPDIIYQNARLLLENKKSWQDLLSKLYSKTPNFVNNDVEQQLYDGFISSDDRLICNKVHFTADTELSELESQFVDPRLKELLFRYRARNFAHTLSDNEKNKWLDYCRLRHDNMTNISSISKHEFVSRVQELYDNDPHGILKSWLDLINADDLAIC